MYRYMFLERESLIKSAPKSRTEIDKDNYVTTIQLVSECFGEMRIISILSMFNCSLL